MTFRKRQNYRDKKQPGAGDGVDREIWGCDEIVLDLESGGGDLTK